MEELHLNGSFASLPERLVGLEADVAPLVVADVHEPVGARWWVARRRSAPPKASAFFTTVAKVERRRRRLRRGRRRRSPALGPASPASRMAARAPPRRARARRRRALRIARARLGRCMGWLRRLSPPSFTSRTGASRRVVDRSAIAAGTAARVARAAARPSVKKNVAPSARPPFRPHAPASAARLDLLDDPESGAAPAPPGSAGSGRRSTRGEQAPRLAAAGSPPRCRGRSRPAQHRPPRSLPTSTHGWSHARVDANALPISVATSSRREPPARRRPRPGVAGSRPARPAPDRRAARPRRRRGRAPPCRPPPDRPLRRSGPESASTPSRSCDQASSPARRRPRARAGRPRRAPRRARRGAHARASSSIRRAAPARTCAIDAREGEAELALRRRRAAARRPRPGGVSRSSAA